MCTLTYLPDGLGGFVLTTNRDESPLRPTDPPALHEIEGKTLLFPQDRMAGGTWIAASTTLRVVCLLNGAFERHLPGKYGKSRGLVLLESFGFHSLEEFSERNVLDGVEPFTLVWVEQLGTGSRVGEFRWDGSAKHIKAIDPWMPHIWSSAQLYRPEIIAMRNQWFAEFMAVQGTNAAAHIHEFHRFGGHGDVYNDLQMNRGLVRTVSTTSVRTSELGLEMSYQDLVSGQNSLRVIVGG
jgi:hypothetical protein